MKKIILISAISSVLMAGGYKVPEVSLNGIALSSANVAHSSGADASYYNPANMVFMKDEHVTENDLTYIGLDRTDYKASGVDISSERENFFLPALHYVSGDISGVRLGLSIFTPAGLTKRWTQDPAVKSAQEFTLQTVEINPTIAVPVGDKLAVAFGVRAIHSYGIVKAIPLAGLAYQDMKGDSIDFGYNLALSYKPTSDLEFGLTYRSKVDLTVKGNANLNYNAALPGPTVAERNYDVSVEVVVPALLNIAVAYTFPTNTTVEFVYERNFWSEYKDLNFQYSDAAAEAVFGGVKDKNWKDTNAFRLGVTQKMDEYTFMGGVVIDETPVPTKTLGYELADSDAIAVSLGARYQLNEKINLGLSALYSMREDRTVTNNDNGIDGEFTGSNPLLISVGFEYKF